MSEAKHTPTPWRLCTTGNLGSAIEGPSGKSYYDGDDGYRIVCSYQECTDSPLYLVQEANRRANGAFIVEAVNNYESLREQLATAQAAYLQFTEASDAKLAKAREALEAVEDALPVGIVVTFAGNPIDHTKLNHAVEAARSCLREISK